MGRTKVNKLYIFKVSHLKVWRKIAIPNGLTLSDLSSAILEGFNFNDEKLHQFEYKDNRGRKHYHIMTSHDPTEQEEAYTDEVLIKNLDIEIGNKIIYTFDLGAMWTFDVKLESITPPVSNITEAMLIDQKGVALDQWP